MRLRGWIGLSAMLGACAGVPASALASAMEPAAEIFAPLSPNPGDPQRGRAIVGDRLVGMCLLCHSGPFPEEWFQGTLAPSLDGAGTRWSATQLRARIVDGKRSNPTSIMPAYHRTTGLQRVGEKWLGKPILDAQQVEDVVAYLVSLR